MTNQSIIKTKGEKAMANQRLRRNIRLYYFYRIFSEPIFWGPILITFIQNVSRMSLPEIYIMESVVIGSLIILQIPTGALADLIGRKKTIFIGAIIFVFGNLMFASANGPLMIWMANIVWTIGYAFVSGADSAFLYDTLCSLKRENDYKKICGHSNSFLLVLLAISAIFVGYLASVHIRLPIYLSTILLVANCIIVLLFTEPPRNKEGNANFTGHLNLMKISMLFVANNAKVKWIIFYVVIISVASKIWFFTYNPYFELVKLPLVYFGWQFFLMNSVAAISSFSADWFSKKIRDKSSLIGMLTFVALPILLMGLLPIQAAVLFILVHSLVRGYVNPFLSNFLNSHLDSSNRATVNSIQSAVVGLTQFIMLMLFGVLLKYVPLTDGLIILGSTTLFLGVIIMVFYDKIFVHSKN